MNSQRDLKQMCPKVASLRGATFCILAVNFFYMFFFTEMWYVKNGKVHNLDTVFYVMLLTSS